MARYEFKLPDIGEGIAEAEIVAWHVKVGDDVAEDQQIADMMTDKATVEMESPVAGKVLEIAGEVGDQIAIGSVLIVIETEGEAGGEPKVEQPIADGMAEIPDALDEVVPTADIEAVERRETGDRRDTEDDRRSDDRGEEDRRIGEWRADKGGKAESASPAKSAAKALASPAVRQRARDLGIDLGQVKYGGDRIRHADLDSYLLYQGGGGASRGASRPRNDEQIKVVGLRRRIAENMQEAKRRIPHFTLVEEFDVTGLEQTRAMMNADRGDNPKLTVLPFLITAFARTLADYPQLNATYDADAQVIPRH